MGLAPIFFENLGSNSGTVSRDFRLLIFFMNQFPLKPLSIPIGPFRIFSKIRGDIRSSRCTTGVVDTGGKWEKSSIRKLFNISWGHLSVVELTYSVRPTSMYTRSQTWTGILDAEKSKTTRESTNSQAQQSVHTTLENDRCKSGFKHLFYN